MNVILSSTLESSLQNEIGIIPNSFIPLGNTRLYLHQIEAFQKAFPKERVAITLPKNYVLNEWDRTMLKKLDVTIFLTDDKNSIGETLHQLITDSALNPEQLRLLLGDNLLGTIPKELDVIALSKTNLSNYWQVEEYNTKYDTVWCGYFSFSNIKSLLQALESEKLNFNRSIQTYAFTNKVKKVHISQWDNCSRLSSYYKARSNFASTRFFNSINVNDGVLTKFSSNKDKMKSEATWFQRMPISLKKYTPQFFEYKDLQDRSSYSLEYVCALTLNEIYVHGRQNVIFWKNIFNKIDTCLKDFKDFPINKNSNTPQLAYNDFIHKKSIKRLNDFAEQTQFDIHAPNFLNEEKLPSIKEILDTTLDLALKQELILGFSHGDLCFSNILYDSTSDTIKLIDPRGIDSSKEEIDQNGNLLYDIAKLSHSMLGFYDHIIARQYHLDVSKNKFTFELFIPEETLEVTTFFEKQVFLNSVTSKDILPLVITLFISMLPLHADNPQRQQAFIANTLRLYKKMKKK